MLHIPTVPLEFLLETVSYVSPTLFLSDTSDKRVFLKQPPYTLAGFDLTTHSSSLLDGRRRRTHYVDHAARALKSCVLELEGYEKVYFLEPILIRNLSPSIRQPLT
jgi:hypothetical protein